MKFRIYLCLILGLFFISNCQSENRNLRLATTTSTYDSGLLDAILLDFESEFDAQVDVIAIGTGQALALGESGDVDVILVHAPAREEAFVIAGHGTARFDVMFNDFVIVGPISDPAGIAGMSTASEALLAIAQSGSSFASRGDDSGTNTKEISLWEAANIQGVAGNEWYKSLGQGMGDTLRFANETAAYTLTDRGTYLALRDTLPNMLLMVGGANIAENQDGTLFNPYGVIPINGNKGNINSVLAMDFVDWITSVKTQEVISGHGYEVFDQPLFYPNSDAWNGR
ncbi:MAG: substrate-binding domain-containing protein [Chloroflexota bacterium]